MAPGDGRKAGPVRDCLVGVSIEGSRITLECGLSKGIR